jgi:hypothetical protein
MEQQRDESKCNVAHSFKSPLDLSIIKKSYNFFLSLYSFPAGAMQAQVLRSEFKRACDSAVAVVGMFGPLMKG